MSAENLSLELLRTTQAAIREKAIASAPKTWKPSELHKDDGSIAITSTPYPEGYAAKEEELLRDHGFDPESFVIVGGIKSSKWQVYKPKQYRGYSEDEETTKDAWSAHFRAFKFTVAPRPQGGSRSDVEELVAALDARQALPPTPLPGLNAGFGVLAIGDTQIGKIDSPVEDLAERITKVFDVVRDRGRRYEHLHLAWLGDCIEGDQSQNGSLRWRTTLTMTEQVRMLQRLMMYSIEQLAPIADRLTVSSVPGNHDNANKRDLQTRVDDSWAIQALVSVEDAIQMSQREDLRHVECYVPGPDQHSVVLGVGGLLIAMTHGDQWRGPEKGMAWWSGQAFGGQPEGEARLLLSGHYHHFRVEEQGDRTQVIVPAMEHESVWWKHKTGTGGNPGALLLSIRGGRIAGIERLHPWEG